MTRHRFTVQIAGQTLYGLAFGSEAELEDFIAGRGGRVQMSADPPPCDLSDEPQARGRPSYDAMLRAAVKSIGKKLNRSGSLSARARLVLTQLAKSHGAQELPAMRTVTAYLTTHSVGKKAGRKYGEKSKRAKLVEPEA